MAPTNSKANYKTYEAQARMVRAIVAAHPDVKWNYKDIAKYFGQSTADGIQFQFRGIKKDADQLRQTHSSGGDVANCLSLPSGTSTPTRATAAARTPGSRKRPRAEPKPSLSEVSGDEEDDWSDRDETPSKRAPKPTPARKTGARKAAVRAGATIAAGAAPDSDSDVVLVKPESQYQSIFGDPAAARAAAAAPSPSTASVAGAFTERATDPVFSTAFGANLYLGSFEEAIEAYGDGEI